MKTKTRRNTPEEEAAINRGIAQDPDAPELTDDFFANARPAIETMPRDLYDALIRPNRPIGKKPAKAAS